MNLLFLNYLKFLKFQNSKLEKLASYAMMWRGYSASPLHPKHLFDEGYSASYQSYLHPGINFLDIGSGVGTACILAAKNGAKCVVGIENNQNNIQIANRRAVQASVAIIFLEYDLEVGKLPFVDRFFDLVIFTNVLEHLNNRIPILRELKRVKKGNGIAIISVPNANTTWKKNLRLAGIDSRDDSDHKIEYSEMTLKRELSEAGLEINSSFHPIVPSFPWHGLFALSAAFSPNIYRRLQRYKRRLVENNPAESIGWVFEAR